MVRTSYVRAAFQLPGSEAEGEGAAPAVRVSLDTHVYAVQEQPADEGGEGGAWPEDQDLQLAGLLPRDLGLPSARRSGERARRLPRQADDASAPGTDAEAALAVGAGDFPHAVLEIKLMRWPVGAPPPAWLSALVHRPAIAKCNLFSKYLNGTACLFPDKGAWGACPPPSCVRGALGEESSLLDHSELMVICSMYYIFAYEYSMPVYLNMAVKSCRAAITLEAIHSTGPSPLLQ